MREITLLVLFFATPPAIAWKPNRDIPPCGEHEWTCRDGSCIKLDAKCNGTAECRDGSDEKYPSCRDNRCPDNMFRCAYGACIDPAGVCDNTPNCNDWSDERNPKCDTTNIVLGKFRCDDGQEIPSFNLCDGIADCTDRSDETTSVCATQSCPAFMYQCAYGACVEQGANCDGVDDCADGSDEIDDICKWRPLSEIKLELPAGYCILPAYGFNGGYTVVGAPNAVPGQGYDAVTLEFFCYEGYGFLGDRVRNCSKGIWSASVPQCTLACKLDQFNSDYMCLNSLDDKESMRICYEYEPDGVLASPRCTPPFYLPDGAPTYMKCVGGNWDYFLTCISGDCVLPKAVSVASYTCSRFEGNKKIEVYCDNEEFVPEGTWIQPICKENYYQVEVNFNIAQCMSGAWTYIPECTPACGRWNFIEKEIVPWHVGVYSKLSTPYEQICGGSLINDITVVSAAHCFWTDRLQPAENYAAAIGKLFRDWDHPDDMNAQRSNINAIKIPSNFNGSFNNFEADLALVSLTSPIQFNTRIYPVCFDLDISFNIKLLHGRESAKVAGWGLGEENNNLSPIVKCDDVSYFLRWSCIEHVALQEYLTFDKICAELITGEGLCNRDAGGGLVYRDHDNPAQSFYLTGVLFQPPSDQCHMESTYMFTFLNEFRYFIKDNIYLR